MKDAGTTNIEVVAEEGKQELSCPEDWWTIAKGSGLRWTIDQLSEDKLKKVKESNLSWVERNNVTAVDTNVIYAAAKKDLN